MNESRLQIHTNLAMLASDSLARLTEFKTTWFKRKQEDGKRGWRADKMAKRQLKIVRLLEPELCLDCRFAQTAEVENSQGVLQRMIYCRRLDCDNWDIVNSEPAKNVRLDEAA